MLLGSLPLNQLPKGAAGTKISKSFAGEFSLLPQPMQPTLLSGAEGKFEVLGLGQQPLSFHTTFMAMDLLTWSSFAQPWHCQDGQEEMGSRRQSPMGWGNQSLNGL